MLRLCSVWISPPRSHRYHKYNLFGERANNVPPSVEYAVFDTDFGVRFGVFICFDILFDKPAAQLARERGVTDFVFSAAWFSEVPFLTGWLPRHHSSKLDFKYGG